MVAAASTTATARMPESRPVTIPWLSIPLPGSVHKKTRDGNDRAVDAVFTRDSQPVQVFCSPQGEGWKSEWSARRPRAGPCPEARHERGAEGAAGGGPVRAEGPAVRRAAGHGHGR